jgi:general secretion pathway protein D
LGVFVKNFKVESMVQKPYSYVRVFFIAVFFLTGCKSVENYNYHDPFLKIKKEDYKDKLFKSDHIAENKPQILSQKKIKEEIIPASFKQHVSLVSTDSVPLKEIFLQLGRQTKINILISPHVKGGLNFHVRNKPLIEAIKEICSVSNLRYEIKDTTLKIEPDSPYLKNYDIHFLSLIRKNQNRISIATDVFSASENYQNDLDNGSSTSLTTTSENDFFQELERNLEVILLGPSDPNHQEESRTSYSIHKQAGIISIYGTKTQHKRIKEYLALLRKSIASQVLIEAKILEVTLKEEFKSGINWSSLKGDFVIQAPLGQIVTPGPLNRTRIPPRDVFTIGGSGHHLTALLSMIEKFGTVRTLSNPRMTVMNNQSAILKVATNRVFFRIDYDRDYGYDSQREHEHVTSEIQTVPIGLMMVVQPSINFRNGTITMTLRPTISRIVNEKEDPAVAIVSKQEQQSFIPEVQVREIDSLLNMQSGEIIIMGGLMEDRSDNDQTAIPEVHTIPVFGELFKSKSNNHTVTELVIFLRATILDDQSQLIPVKETSINPHDLEVYQNFTKDPRPFNF